MISRTIKYLKQNRNKSSYFNFSYFKKYNQREMEIEYTFKSEKLDLTEKEEKIFSLLKKVAEKNQLNTVMRVAGGWVRDKVISF